MKVEILGRILKGSDGVYGAAMSHHHVTLDSPPYDPNSAEPTRVRKNSGLSLDGLRASLDGPRASPPYDPNSEEPTRVRKDGLWAYRSTLVLVKGGNQLSLDEVLIGIKHAVLRHDKAFERMRREVEAFENMEPADIARREQIPQSVRLFVWQRDQGKCVRCGSAEKLEFDHIIPVVKGGSSTERNIQLLCEQCNRAKGSAV